MTKKLNPTICKCPACGRHAGIIEYSSSSFRVGCFNSRACGVKGPVRKSKHGAVTAWNRMLLEPKAIL